MLTKVLERFVIRREQWDVPENDLGRLSLLVDYRNNLVRNRFLCRKNCIIYEDRKEPIAYLSGILAHNEALKDARNHPDIEELNSKIDSELVLERSCQFYNFDADNNYCVHDQWNSLILACDHVFGTPSLICGDCAGVIASYRVKMTEETALKLFYWEEQHDAIDDLSVLCSEYESCADKELYNIHSKINTLGLSVATSLSQELGSDVRYLFDPGDKSLSDCPRCSQPLHKTVRNSSYRECPSCRIVVRQDE